MNGQKTFKAIGLMSGTSMDGVDAALIESDGEGSVRRFGFFSLPYSDAFRDRLKAILGTSEADQELAKALRLFCARARDCVSLARSAWLLRSSALRSLDFAKKR